MIATLPGSPGASSGLETGDLIVAVNAESTSTGKAGVAQFETAVKKSDDGPVELSIDRKGVSQKIIVTPVSACSFPVTIEKSDSINAYTDGGHIYVLSGMLGFVKSDDELALIIGHEMGHDTMSHVRMKETNAVIGTVAGGILGVLVTGLTGVNVINTMANEGAQLGALTHGQAFESEADYVGIYYAARAGYSVTDAGDLWRRMAASHPEVIHVPAGSSHPSTATRFVALEEAVKEIESKQKAQQPLLPEMKNQPDVAATDVSTLK